MLHPSGNKLFDLIIRCISVFEVNNSVKYTHVVIDINMFALSKNKKTNVQNAVID